MALCRRLSKVKFISVVVSPFRQLKLIGITPNLTLLQNWIPLLKILRVLGNAPIQIKPLRNQNSSMLPNLIEPRTDYFKIRVSISALPYTLIWAAVRALLVLSIYYPTEFSWMYYPSCHTSTHGTENISASASKTEKLIQPLAESIAPTMICIEWISLLVCFPDFVKFLNNWQKFGNARSQITTINLHLAGCILFLLATIEIVANIIMIWNNSAGKTICNVGLMSLLMLFEIVTFVEIMKILYMICTVVAAMSTVRKSVLNFLLKLNYICVHFCPIAHIASIGGSTID